MGRESKRWAGPANDALASCEKMGQQMMRRASERPAGQASEYRLGQRVMGWERSKRWAGPASDGLGQQTMGWPTITTNDEPGQRKIRRGQQTMGWASERWAGRASDGPGDRAMDRASE
jgi:hypothetical protein